MMVLSPYVVNDARRLLISPHGVSYLMRPTASDRLAKQVEVDGVDFGRLFARQQADSLTFTSALRMNCAYRLSYPTSGCPPTPALRPWMRAFATIMAWGWPFASRMFSRIQQNTSGVVFVQIRCWDKISAIDKSDDKGILENLLTPAAAAGNMTDVQDSEQDNTLSLLSEQIMGKNRIEMVRFHYHAVRPKSGRPH